LLSPGLAAPPLAAAALMAAAGVAWGVYSLLGARNSAIPDDPVARTARNFLLAAIGAALAVAIWPGRISAEAALLACASGAVTSAGGYVLWYAVLPKLAPVTAASVQLSVPVITAIFGLVLLGDVPSWQLLGGSVAILAGIALTVVPRH
jgi:drug/metabolite transporter (DMT)-like permease